MEKHTPGPWTFERHPEESQYFGNIIGHYTPNTIRTISCQLRYGTLEEREANAALIAAAPDLLKAACDILTSEVYADDRGPLMMALANAVRKVRES